MNILITGGTGFTGSHLAEALLGRGDTVCVIDKLSTGSMENVQNGKKKVILTPTSEVYGKRGCEAPHT